MLIPDTVPQLRRAMRNDWLITGWLETAMLLAGVTLIIAGSAFFATIIW
jgi:hypothetical protein